MRCTLQGGRGSGEMIFAITLALFKYGFNADKLEEEAIESR